MLCPQPSLTERTADDHRQPPARYGAMGSALRGRLATVLLHHVGGHDRKLGYAVRANVSQKTGDLVSSGIIRRQKGVAALVKTITYDNGKEFAGHARLDCTLKFKGFFVETFSSWQRGASENLNGLIRQYISKKKLPISTLTDTELAMIEDRLKNRPRKRLGFKTRHELFSQSLNRLGLRMRIQERIYG